MTLVEQIKALDEMPHPDEVKSMSDFDYIEIDTMQTKLDKIFGANRWSWKITSSSESGFHHLITGDLTVVFTDGSVTIRSGGGGSQIRVKKDTGVAFAGGSVMDFPKSNSESFKNACQQLGRAFGRDLRRNTDITGKKASKQSENYRDYAITNLKDIRLKITECTTIEELNAIAESDFAIHAKAQIETKRMKLEGIKNDN